MKFDNPIGIWYFELVIDPGFHRQTMRKINCIDCLCKFL